MNPDVYRAASTGNSSFFENLTDPSSTLLQVTTEKNTVLHVALQFEQFHVVEELVRLRPSLVYEKNSKGNTPLHVAVRLAGASSTVKLIIQKAKDQQDVEAGGQQLLSMVNEDGDTALQVAVRYDNDDEFEIVRELMKEDPKLAKHVNNDGESALFLAVDRENYKMARHILSAAPDDCSYAGRHGMNVLHALVLHTSCYINKGHLLSPRELDTHGKATRFGRALITFVWVVNMLFLHTLRESAMRQDEIINRSRLPRTFGTIPEDFVKEVMEKCPSTVEQGDDSGWTPLHIAAHMGNRKFVKLLLEKGKSPAYLRNKEGLSAFHIAAKEGNHVVMEELMEACPDIYELLDNRGRTALHVAAESGITDKAFSIFVGRPEFKGFFNEKDKEGNTLAHLESINDQYMISSYYGRGVDLNVTNKEGFTTMDNVLLHRKLNSFATSEYWSKGARPSLRGALLKMGIQKLDPRGKPKLAGTVDGDGTPSNFVKQVSETNMLVATLIATVTFTAAFTVPGGFNQNGNVGEGLAVLSKITAFRVFLIANTLAFGLSTTSVFVRFLASATITEAVFHRKVARRNSLLINWSIGALLVAFIAGTYTVVPHSLGIAVVVILCCCFLSTLFFPLSLDEY